MRLDKLTTRFQEALADAQSLALGNDNPYIEPVHLLLAMLHRPDEATKDLLARVGANTDALDTALGRVIKHLPQMQSGEQVQVGRDLGNLLQQTEKEGIKHGDQLITSELFLLAVADDKGEAGRIAHEHGLSRKPLETVIGAVRGGQTAGNAGAESQREALEKYTIDLTEVARIDKLNPVIGHGDEICRAIQILQHRTKNNPVLIGEPGVGKTAIVEGLMQRIVNEEVPESLKNKRVLVLDVAGLLAGAKYRGGFEGRLKAVLSDTTKEESRTVLFIDEIHTMVGAGKAEGAMDAGDMLGPALARGEPHYIGVATLDKYRKYIKEDATLERRFQKVLVGEPTVEAAIAVLRGLQEKYELHRDVKIADPAIVAAAGLSHRCITDRFLPDKAIDLIDEAAARIKMEIDSKPETMDKLDRRLIQLKIERGAVKKETDEVSRKRLELIEQEIRRLQKGYAGLDEVWKAKKGAAQGAAALKEEIDRIKLEITKLQRESKLKKVAELQYGKLPELEGKLKAATAVGSAGQKQPNKLLRTQVGVEEIAEVVSRTTGIPVAKIMTGEREKLLKMGDRLYERVVGQDETVHLVSDTIHCLHAGVTDEDKPYSSFLFLGPTGVGKTGLCKALTGFLFDPEGRLIHIDMSEFMERHSVNRLISTSPGYIGHEEGGYLTEAMRRKPYSVVLLDKMGKAHPDVFNVLLQVLDDGHLTDGQGHTVDFENTVIVMTSNLGLQLIRQMATEPADVIKGAVWQEVKTYFRPEFLSRIDEVVVFRVLDQRNIESIARIRLKRLPARLARIDLALGISDEAVTKLASTGYDPVSGARPLRRAIQQQIEDPVARMILEGKFAPKDMVPVDYRDGQFSPERIVR